MAINTLVTIKDSITAFAVGHGQLQGRVIFEADDHRSAYITEENTYPLLFVAPIDVAVNRAMNVHTLRVYVYERINDDRLDVWENANDTSLILRDIRVWWNDYGVDDINIVEDPIGQFGCDKELDNLVGYFADIRFEIPSHGRCQVPVDVVPGPPSPSCADATQVIEDSLGNELYSNAIPSGATETQVIQDSAYTVEYVNGTLIESGSILAESSVTVQVPNPIVCEDATVNVNSVFWDNVPSGGTENIIVRQSTGSTQVGSIQGQYFRIADSTAVLKDTSGTTISTTSIKAEDTEDIILPDETITITDELGNPLDVITFPVYSTLNIDIDSYCTPCPPAAPRSTATLTRTGQTTVYRTGDDADTSSEGRPTDFLTLDAAPLHNDGSATINTTTARFTDTLGGSTYANDWVLDWSTWNGSTLLGYYRVLLTGLSWNNAIDNCIISTFGGFTGCRMMNFDECNNLYNKENLNYITYAPFNHSTGFRRYYTSSTPKYATTSAYIMQQTNASFATVGKTTADAFTAYVPVRTFSLSTSNVLS
jgi:hypothetical protein